MLSRKEVAAIPLIGEWWVEKRANYRRGWKVRWFGYRRGRRLQRVSRGEVDKW